MQQDGSGLWVPESLEEADPKIRSFIQSTISRCGGEPVDRCIEAVIRVLMRSSGASPSSPLEWFDQVVTLRRILSEYSVPLAGTAAVEIWLRGVDKAKAFVERNNDIQGGN